MTIVRRLRTGEVSTLALGAAADEAVERIERYFGRALGPKDRRDIAEMLRAGRLVNAGDADFYHP